MSSISKINSFEKVNVAELKANESTTNPMAAIKDYGYDSFTPSFKGAKVSEEMCEKARKNVMALIREKFGSGLGMKATAAGLMAAVMASCVKVEVNVDFSAFMEIIAQYLAEMKAEQHETNSQLAALNDKLQRVIDLLILQGHTMTEINNVLHDMDVSMTELVEGNADLIEVMNYISKLLEENNNLTAEGNQLLAKIFAMTVNIYNMSELTNDQIANIAKMLKKLIQQVAGMSHMLAGYYNTIIELLKTLDADLLAVGADVVDHILDLDQHQQEGFAQVMTMMQNIQDENKAMFLQLMAKLTGMQYAQAQQYFGLMAFLQNMQNQFHGDFLNMLNMMAQIHDDNQAGVNAIIAAIQNMGAQMAGDFAQLWEHLDQIEANQVTQIQQIANLYVSIENGNATLDQILEAIQNLHFEIPEVNLDVIQGLLEQINDHLGILGDINNNTQATANFTGFIATVVNQIKFQIAHLDHNVSQYAGINFSYLDDILNAILGINIQECGCDCDQIIELLVEILTNLENGVNHEGYEDEYDFIDLP